MKYFCVNRKTAILKLLFLITNSQNFMFCFAQTTTFSYSGSFQTYNIPYGVSTLQADVYGASGGTTVSYMVPGKGGFVSCTIDVVSTSISELFVAVGGEGSGGGEANYIIKGGWNGGGSLSTVGNIDEFLLI